MYLSAAPHLIFWVLHAPPGAGAYKINRVADLMEYMELLRQHSIASKGARKNCPSLKRYGIDVPRKAIAESCPVPQALQAKPPSPCWQLSQPHLHPNVPSAACLRNQ